MRTREGPTTCERNRVPHYPDRAAEAPMGARVDPGPMRARRAIRPIVELVN
jgi:hypothetical protein